MSKIIYSNMYDSVLLLEYGIDIDKMVDGEQYT